MPWFWFQHMRNFGVRVPPGCSRRGVSVHCMCVQILSFYATEWPVLPSCLQLTQLTQVSWYVASMSCYYCWMFSLSAALPMHSYVKYESFVSVALQISVRHNLFVQFPADLFYTWNQWYIMANTLKMLTSWLSNVHFNSWIYGLVPRADCKQWDVISVLIQLLYGRVLSAQTFTLFVNPFRVFVRVPELAGDVHQ